MRHSRRTRAQAFCAGLIHDLVRSAAIVWRLAGVAPRKVTALVEIDFEPPRPATAATIWSVNGANRDLFFFVGGTPTAGTQVRRSRLSTIQDAGEKSRRWRKISSSTPGQIAP